ncbi:MAG: ATP-binding protein [Bacteriovorax sp.]|nr:ATP-binding protein [Bacteriovorax sp.]
MHRSYEGTNSAIMVYWFDDRIEIINGGGLFGRMTPENFGRAGFADYRNPDIAEVMKVLGFVQRFGVGVQTAQNELIENHNKPAEFTHELTTTLCKVWSRTEVQQEKQERHQVGTKSKY